jgi:hypothetical protein
MTTPRFPADDGLERELRALGESLDLPPTPDLVTPVRAALAAEGSHAVGRSWSVFGRQVRLSVVLALLAAALAVGIVAGAVLVLGPLRIAFVERVPTPPESVPSGELGANLGLGALLDDIAAAKQEVRFTLFVPTTPPLSKPDAVFYSDLLAGGQVSFVYAPGAGRPPETDTGVSVLVTQFPGGMEEELAQKSVGPGTTVEILTVNGGLGFWIEGRPHVITYRNPAGNYGVDFMRLVHNSLAWEQDGTVLRIEGDLTREEAIAIANSFVRALEPP